MVFKETIFSVRKTKLLDDQEKSHENMVREIKVIQDVRVIQGLHLCDPGFGWDNRIYRRKAITEIT